MRILKWTVILLGIGAAIRAPAQDSPEHAVAKAIDGEILKLKELPEDARATAIKDLAHRIQKQPKEYRVALALNLAIEAEAASERDTLQEVTTTLANALRNSRQDQNEPAYTTLAQLARYNHMRVSLSNPQYSAALSKLEADDRHRSDADFTLTDLRGESWNLRHLRGKVVLVNFWATWCPPCRKEIPDLNELHRHFEGKDLVILSISAEEAPTVKPFIAQREIDYPVLLDPGDKVRNLFLVTTLPYSLVYDREGHLVAQAIDRLTLQGFLEMVGRAGLH